VRTKGTEPVTDWVVKDGALASLVGARDIATEQKFDDFELHLEFLLPAGASSAVYLRGRHWIRIEDGAGDGLGKSKEPCGSVAGEFPARSNMYRGSATWNALDVRLIGRKLTVAVNGVVVLDGVALQQASPNSIDFNMDEPGPILLRRGPSLFRNITVKLLD